MDGSGNYPKRYTVIFSRGSSSSVLLSWIYTLHEMRKIYEKEISRSNFIMCCLVLHLCPSYQLGKLSIQLEKLGDELGQQLDELSEFSIKLEKQ
jgi:hypothetical protein